MQSKAFGLHLATVSFLFSPEGNGRFYRNESHISYRILSFRKERHIKFYHFGEYCGLSFLFRPMRIPQFRGALHKATQAACQGFLTGPPTTDRAAEL